jgi:hypothetical protein
MFRRGILVSVWLSVVPVTVIGDPSHVFVYNHDPDDNFDNAAEGIIWQLLGLLNPETEEPIDVPEEQIIRDDHGNIIGYKSADGQMEAYDVNSSATTDQAWQRVADGGTLHIFKHGATFETEAGVVRAGGGVRLDGGTLHGGFKKAGSAGTGTGVEFDAGPYPLTERSGVTVDVNINSCYSSNDPDGDDATFTSVTGSLGGVPGVGNATGNEGWVDKGVSVGV